MNRGTGDGDVAVKIDVYQRANKEVKMVALKKKKKNFTLDNGDAHLMAFVMN